MSNSISWLMASITGFFMIAVVILFLIVIINNNKHRKRLEDITLYQINVNSIIDKSIPEVLELIIRESFTDYRIKYLEPLQEGFINNDREAEIRRDLVSLVTGRISNAALDKLSLFYNTSNLADILADKIYIMVMDYVTSHNSSFIARG